MTCPPKEPLLTLTQAERDELSALARSRNAPADRLAGAKELLAVAEGQTFGQAAHQAGRTSRQAVARLVRRFNQEGMPAVAGHHGGGPALAYGSEE